MARVALAVMFATAGVAKLLDLGGSRQAVIDFGVPERLAGAARMGLPVAELAVAVALLPRATARWGAVAAVALLALFSMAILAAVRRGEAPDCHCFGQLRADTAGPRTLVRNAVLAVIAAAVAVIGWSDPGASAGAWVTRLSGPALAAIAGGLLVAVVLAVQTRFIVELLRQNGRLLERLDNVEQQLGVAGGHGARDAEPGQAGLPVGSTAPHFTLPGLDGDELSLDWLLELGLPGSGVLLQPVAADRGAPRR